MTCYQYLRRSNFRSDRPMARLHDTAPRAIDVNHRLDRSDNELAVTFAEWCESRGYNPSTRTYA